MFIEHIQVVSQNLCRWMDVNYWTKFSFPIVQCIACHRLNSYENQKHSTKLRFMYVPLLQQNDYYFFIIFRVIEIQTELYWDKKYTQLFIQASLDILYLHVHSTRISSDYCVLFSSCSVVLCHSWWFKVQIIFIFSFVIENSLWNK